MSGSSLASSSSSSNSAQLLIPLGSFDWFEEFLLGHPVTSLLSGCCVNKREGWKIFMKAEHTNLLVWQKSLQCISRCRRRRRRWPWLAAARSIWNVTLPTLWDSLLPTGKVDGHFKAGTFVDRWFIDWPTGSSICSHLEESLYLKHLVYLDTTALASMPVSG